MTMIEAAEAHAMAVQLARVLVIEAVEWGAALDDIRCLADNRPEMFLERLVSGQDYWCLPSHVGGPLLDCIRRLADVADISAKAASPYRT